MRASRRRGMLATLLVVVLGLLAFLVHQLRWFGDPLPWREATGFDRIPPRQRPADGPAWTASSATDEPPEIRWLGHSGFVIRWKGQQVLLDPNTSARCTIACRVLEPAADVAALGRVDAVVLSHAHRDHLDLPTIRRLAGVAHVVVPLGADIYFERARWPGTSIDPLEAGQCLPVGMLEICGVPAQHNGNRDHPFTSHIHALGYVVRSADGSGSALYYSGDTGAAIDLDAVRERFHPRIAILPIGAWLPRIPMKYYHLSPEEAADAAARLGVETVIPCHFGTFYLSADPPSRALPRFAAAAAARGLRWRMPRLLSGSDDWSAP